MKGSWKVTIRMVFEWLMVLAFIAFILVTLGVMQKCNNEKLVEASGPSSSSQKVVADPDRKLKDHIKKIIHKEAECEKFLRLVEAGGRDIDDYPKDCQGRVDEKHEGTEGTFPEAE